MNRPRRKLPSKRKLQSGINIRDIEEPDDSILESSSPSDQGSGSSERSDNDGDSGGEEAGNAPWQELGIELDNPTHRQRFRTHAAQTIMPTKYYDPKTTLRLGFRDPLLELIDRLGFTGFIALGPHKTSRRLTLEFICTVEWVGRPLGRDSRITFRLLNREFDIPLTQLNQIMGWDPNSPTEFERANYPACENREAMGTKHPSNFNPNFVWQTIAKERFHSRIKASAIVHPAFRYLHRMLVYACFGRTQIGQPSQKDILALWLGLEPRDPDFSPLVNFGEMWVHHWINYRKSLVPRTKLIMGGGVTRLLVGLLGEEALEGITYISDEVMLNTQALIDGHHILASEHLGRWSWLVADRIWCELPNPRAGKRFSELRSKDVFGLPQDECLAAAVAQPRSTHVPRGSARGASSSRTPISAPAPASLESIQAQLHSMQVAHSHQTDLLHYMFSQGVESGVFQPYLNFPYYPMQQGPVPGWQDRRPTFPYYPHRPEGLDYRFPGGSNPLYDPNIPPLDHPQPPPPDFHDSVPPMEETWGTAPMPPWGDYAP